MLMPSFIIEPGDVFHGELRTTPLYRAPKIVASNGYSEAVDVWSAGVLLYKMLVGVYPFGPKARNQSDCTITNLSNDILNKHLDFTVGL